VNETTVHIFNRFYRAMHFSAMRGLEIACRLSVRPPVCLSVTLVICDHIGWKSWKLITRTISPYLCSLQPIYDPPTSRGTWGNFGENRGRV